MVPVILDRQPDIQRDADAALVGLGLNRDGVLSALSCHAQPTLLSPAGDDGVLLFSEAGTFAASFTSRSAS